MKKNLIFVLLWLLGSASVVGAHPPRGMELRYDAHGKTLHITMEHVSKKLRDHFIREIIVTKNNESPVVYRHTRQNDPSFMETSVPLEAQSGDMIHVKAVCREGGSEEASLKIADEEQPQP